MLEAEFHLIGLENNNIDESKWKTLLSEYKLMNNHKQNDLDKKFKKLE